LILPGVTGFSAAERPDGPVINLSYYVFPAFARLALVAPEFDWPGLTATGLDLVKAARFGAAQLPSDWIALRDGAPKPAQNFPAQFSYNAIRVPLYLAWAGVGEWEHFAAFSAWANSKRGALGTVDVVTGREAERLGERGYMGIAHLLGCAIDRTTPPADFRLPRDGEHYYSATIQLMAITAVNMRYASCLKN
jgi:endoglucanase